MTAPEDDDLFETQVVGNVITVKLAGSTILSVDAAKFDGPVIESGIRESASTLGRAVRSRPIPHAVSKTLPPKGFGSAAPLRQRRYAQGQPKLAAKARRGGAGKVAAATRVCRVRSDNS